MTAHLDARMIAPEVNTHECAKENGQRCRRNCRKAPQSRTTAEVWIKLWQFSGKKNLAPKRNNQHRRTLGEVRN